MAYGVPGSEVISEPQLRPTPQLGEHGSFNPLCQVGIEPRSWHYSDASDPVFSQQQLGKLLRCKFNPWPTNFHMPGLQPQTKTNHKIKLAKNSKMFLCYLRIYRNIFTGIPVIEKGFQMFKKSPEGTRKIELIPQS